MSHFFCSLILGQIRVSEVFLSLVYVCCHWSASVVILVTPGWRSPLCSCSGFHHGSLSWSTFDVLFFQKACLLLVSVLPSLSYLSLILDLLSLQVSHTGKPPFIYKQSTVVGSQAEHSGMRTYYFSADTQEDMNTWLKAMNEAVKMQNRNEAPIK